jgi:hypothetical protein
MTVSFLASKLRESGGGGKYLLYIVTIVGEDEELAIF